MWEVPTDPQHENDSMLEELQSLSSSGITGQKVVRAILQVYTDQQKKVMMAGQIKILQGTEVQN